MTIDGIMIVILSMIIISLLFIMYVMYVRIKQLLEEVEKLTSRMEITGTELEQLTRSVDEFKQMRM
jgi:predicted Holliday junction resolvase-like endonuclease